MNLLGEQNATYYFLATSIVDSDFRVWIFSCTESHVQWDCNDTPVFDSQFPIQKPYDSIYPVAWISNQIDKFALVLFNQEDPKDYTQGCQIVRIEIASPTEVGRIQYTNEGLQGVNVNGVRIGRTQAIFSVKSRTVAEQLVFQFANELDGSVGGEILLTKHVIYTGSNPPVIEHIDHTYYEGCQPKNSSAGNGGLRRSIIIQEDSVWNLNTYSVESEDDGNVRQDTEVKTIASSGILSFCSANQNMIILDSENLSISYESLKGCTNERNIISLASLGLESVTDHMTCLGQYAQILGKNPEGNDTIITFNLETERNYDNFVQFVSDLELQNTTTTASSYRNAHHIVNVMNFNNAARNEGENSKVTFNTQIAHLDGARVIIPSQETTAEQIGFKIEASSSAKTEILESS